MKVISWAYEVTCIKKWEDFCLTITDFTSQICIVNKTYQI